jgi:hypothetical protein
LDTNAVGRLGMLTLGHDNGEEKNEEEAAAAAAAVGGEETTISSPNAL